MLLKYAYVNTYILYILKCGYVNALTNFIRHYKLY